MGKRLKYKKGHGNYPEPIARTCRCGCGESFMALKSVHYFKDPTHRQAYHIDLTKKGREIAKSLHTLERTPPASAS